MEVEDTGKVYNKSEIFESVKNYHENLYACNDSN